MTCFVLKISVSLVRSVDTDDFHCRIVEKIFGAKMASGKPNLIHSEHIQYYHRHTHLSPEELSILTALKERGVILDYSFEVLELEEHDAS